MFDGFAVLEVYLYHLGYILLYDAEVPGTGWVNDEVRAVLTEAEALYRVHAYVPVYALRAQFIFERPADGFGSAFLAVTAFADEHVGVVIPDLRDRLCERRRRAALLRGFFLRLLTSLRNNFLRS